MLYIDEWVKNQIKSLFPDVDIYFEYPEKEINYPAFIYFPVALVPELKGAYSRRYQIDYWTDTAKDGESKLNTLLEWTERNFTDIYNLQLLSADLKKEDGMWRATIEIRIIFHRQ